MPRNRGGDESPELSGGSALVAQRVTDDCLIDRHGEQPREGIRAHLRVFGNLPPDFLVPDLVDGVEVPTGKKRPAPTVDVSSGFAGTASERSVVNGVASPVLGVSADEVPDIATLLFGPLARGMEVELR